MKKLFVVSVAALFATVALAQAEKFTVAGGGGAKQGSVYSAMLGDLASVCSTPGMPLEEVNTNGGVTNLELLRSNKVKAALVPADLLLAAKLENATSVANVKTLAVFHQEEVHLIARADTKTEGGLSLGKFGNIGGDKVAFNQADDLRGRKVGAVGGSVVTARILSDFLKLGLRVEPYKENTDLFGALEKGEIDAAVIVAGQPSPVVKALTNGRFKFLALRNNQDLAAVYVPTKVQYPNVSEGKAIDTIATEAMLVTRTFRSQEALAQLAALRSCFQKNLNKIQDKDGTHAKWQKVEENNRGKWDWYDLQVAAPAQATAAKR
jgi:TRAP-type uncharacterized transport system substrate-binding protein